MKTIFGFGFCLWFHSCLLFSCLNMSFRPHAEKIWGHCILINNFNSTAFTSLNSPIKDLLFHSFIFWGKTNTMIYFWHRTTWIVKVKMATAATKILSNWFPLFSRCDVSIFGTGKVSHLHYMSFFSWLSFSSSSSSEGSLSLLLSSTPPLESAFCIALKRK